MPVNREKAKQYFDQVKFRMEELKLRLIPMIESLVHDADIDFHNVSGRTKSENSFMEKVDRKSYDDLPEQMTDFCGIRVITYFPSQAAQIAKVLRTTFFVDETNSSDKADDLGDSRVGYQSLHLVCTLGNKRRSLPEYEALADLKFEIQIRTILQHAWAELAHDGSYKFSGELPPKLQRKLNLQAGVLELVDEQLEEISTNIKKYERELSKSKSKLQAEGLNALSFEQFYVNVSSEWDDVDTGSWGHAEAVKELRVFGISTIAELRDAAKQELIEDLTKRGGTTSIGLAREIMMHTDLKKYFEKTYSTYPRWQGIPLEDLSILDSKYGADFVREVLTEHSIDIDVEEDEFTEF